MPDVRFVDSVREVPAAAWNALVERHGGSVFHRHEWLAAIEDADMVRAAPRHAVVTGPDGLPHAVAPLLHTESCPKLEMFRSRYVDAGIAGTALLVGHSLYAQSSEILGTAAHRAAVLDAMGDVIGLPGRAPAVLLPLVPGDAPLLGELRDRGWATGLLSCTNMLPVRWDSFEEYLDWLPSSKRKNIRKSMQRSEAAGAVCTVERGGADTTAMAALIRSTAEHHGSPLFFDEQFLRTVMDRLGPAAVVFTVYGGGRPVLACLALDAGGELAPWSIGLDYDSLPRYGQYNYLYSQLVRYAVENRRRIVNFGRSTYYIKRKYGCSLRPVYAAATGTEELRPALADWVDRIDTHARAELTAVGLPQPPRTLLGIG
ncbi:GNAT family N-acetyltransferase [Streptomyces sp. NPDC088354]|uniref:GNAT family N-acetyltransferase n=1 Tax=unclassified Streptomyces TaxID=2593676 RepID=UPI0029B993BE|nr:GNAT family N-acetyltransferase [Streptomyces sp. MI02-7b]MDX3074179.1 GNAT family N-acetyltransferase [Streptomyces sp. MI02-7b]